MEISYRDYEALRVEREGGILRITIARPEKKNAIDAALHAEFGRIFVEAQRDDETRVVVLTGEGEVFSAGGDLAWVDEACRDPQLRFTMINTDRMIQHSLLDLDKPVIARVIGPAIGLGCSLALFSDFVYATPDARFADPHVSVGLVAGDGGAILWPALIGFMRAKRYLLTGDPVTGAAAAEMGLITEAVPREELDAAVEEMAARMAEGPSLAIRWTKAAVNASLKQIADAVLDTATGYEGMSMFTEDHANAIAAFMNKQKPSFKGR